MTAELQDLIVTDLFFHHHRFLSGFIYWYGISNQCTVTITLHMMISNNYNCEGIKWCVAHEDLREGMDLENENELVRYISKVLARRAKKV